MFCRSCLSWVVRGPGIDDVTSWGAEGSANEVKHRAPVAKGRTPSFENVDSIPIGTKHSFSSTENSFSIPTFLPKDSAEFQLRRELQLIFPVKTEFRGSPDESSQPLIPLGRKTLNQDPFENGWFALEAIQLLQRP